MKSVLAATLAVALLLAGCGDDDNDPGAAIDDRVSDFSLTDVNPNSETHDASISPRDYLGRVSAWYFGHST